MIYIVLGMHKSGTTLVSQILHHSGISMGDDFDDSLGYRDNKYEWREPFLVNLDLLNADEASYYSLDYYEPCTASPSESVQERMASLIEQRESAGGNWGFKEPLTCLTYTQWARVLPAHKIIGVYRDPSQVMSHYKTPNWNPKLGFKVLRAWSNYNRAMLEALHSAAGDSLLLRYEELMTGDAEFGRLEQFLQRSSSDRRKPADFHARTTHSLFAPLDLFMAWMGQPRPSQIVAELDQLRASQLSAGHSEMP